MSTEEKPIQTRVSGEYLEIQTERSWRGKTGGYFRSETVILKILDRDGNEVDGVWENVWRESAPGIETRNLDEGYRTSFGKQEVHLGQAVRIHQTACPVSVQFAGTDEYIDYDDQEFASYHHRTWWVRYVV